jgi:hypothetical protein
MIQNIIIVSEVEEARVFDYITRKEHAITEIYGLLVCVASESAQLKMDAR